MGFGALAMRTIGLGALGLGLWASGSYVMDRVNSNNVVIEQGYVNPKSLSIEGKKNASGNIEAYLNYNTGDETISLPVKRGPHGPLVGTVEYWWRSLEAEPRANLVQSEWPVLNNGVKHSILSSELQAVLDSFYGVNNAPKLQTQPQQQTQRSPQYAPQRK